MLNILHLFISHLDIFWEKVLLHLLLFIYFLYEAIHIYFGEIRHAEKDQEESSK